MIKAGYSDKFLVVNILSQAFDTNPSINYIVKQDVDRVFRVRKLMEYSFEVCYTSGAIYLSDDRLACALTLFPDQKKTTLKTLWLDIKLAYAVIGLSRIKKIMAREAKIHKGYPKEPVFYLWFLGVVPAYQKNGIGSKLLKEVIEASVVSGRPVYLETSLPDNVTFYRKHGFQIYNQLMFDTILYCLERPLES